MEKIMDILQYIAHFGKNPDGSYTRRLYTPEYEQAVAAARELMEQGGMTTSRDAAGNILGILPGTDPTAKHILLGSHLDTVPHGGLFDGAYGVAAALGALLRLKREGKKLRHTLEIYGFNGEEASGVGGTFGSRVITGLVSPKQPQLAENLAQWGHTVQEIMDAKRNFSDALCFLETHIEQGGILEKKNLEIGVVTGISNIVRYTVTAHGLANHGGTTPMVDRHDAMVAMAKLIVATDAACRAIGHNLVFTPGKISCSPNAGNVVPETVVCSFEMRNLEKKYTDALIEEVRKTAATIKEVTWDIELLLAKDSAECDSRLQKLIEESCQEAGATYQYMPSGAGHDAESLAHKIPVAMIFIPSHLGISHNGKEYTAPEFVERGGDILYRTLLKVDSKGL